MTFIAIRNLVDVLIILTFVNSTTLPAVTATTASFISSSAASTLVGLQKDRRIPVVTSTMSSSSGSSNDDDDGIDQTSSNHIMIQTKSSSAMNMEKDELYIESMEPVKFNDSKQQQTPTRKRGRPGIVVFSGGTAFNAAAAEMALRNVASVVATSSSRVVASNNDAGVGLAGGLDDDSIKSENSIHEMMMMTSMMMSQSNTNNNNNNIMEGGGIKVWHVLPVTDDGGSTAEIVRVLGGPAVGDIRSRLLRLAPGHTREGRAVRRLLGHRLVSLETIKKQQQRRRSSSKYDEEEEEEEITADKVSRMAREEWFDIIDGGMESHRHHGLRHYADDEEEEDNDDESDSDDYEHPLWKGVSTPYRSIIRSFLVHFHSQVMHTHNGIRHSSRNPPFDFTGETKNVATVNFSLLDTTDSHPSPFSLAPHHRWKCWQLFLCGCKDVFRKSPGGNFLI